MNLDPATISNKINSLELVITFFGLSVLCAIIVMPLFIWFFQKRNNN